MYSSEKDSRIHFVILFLILCVILLVCQKHFSIIFFKYGKENSGRVLERADRARLTFGSDIVFESNHKHWHCINLFTYC